MENLDKLAEEFDSEYEMLKEIRKLRNAMVVVKENSLNPAHTMTMRGLEETVDSNYKLAVDALGH